MKEEIKTLIDTGKTGMECLITQSPEVIHQYARYQILSSAAGLAVYSLILWFFVWGSRRAFKKLADDSDYIGAFICCIGGLLISVLIWAKCLNSLLEFAISPATAIYQRLFQ